MQLLSQLIGCFDLKATSQLRQPSAVASSAGRPRRQGAGPYGDVMYYLGGFAIGIVLVVVLVMAAVKTMRKR